MRSKNIIITAAISILSAVLVVFSYSLMTKNTNNESVIKNQTDSAKFQLASSSSFQSGSFTDFTYAAEKSINTVVHVKTSYMTQTAPTIFDYFFGGNYEIQSTPVMNSGSGVIVSSDGYIATNYHVINGSDYIQVVLNDQRSYEAKIIGADSQTDIALLKIDESNLPFITYGNSDIVKIGEWVLAVGNPFNLTSTATAGIISAKARNINILSNYSIESFIQFDAAVNPGNSGGALVNLNGDLIGINTAIASKNGSFVGYSFAIPVNIVKKIIADLIEFGEVQRAYLGLTIGELDAEKAASLGIDDKKGVYISGLTENGAAIEAGIKKGDIIIEFGGYEISSIPQLHEQLSKYRPGDKVEIVVKRGSKNQTLMMTLRNRNNTTGILKNDPISLLGATIKDLPIEDKQRLRLKYGAKITDIQDGSLLNAGIKKGFIITRINRQPVYSAVDAKNILESQKGVVVVEGYYSNGISAYYTLEL
ncbi:MAG: trypsin-like peptidase domain-containing protein [Bacteroidota bacterium]